MRESKPRGGHERRKSPDQRHRRLFEMVLATVLIAVFPWEATHADFPRVDIEIAQRDVNRLVFRLNPDYAQKGLLIISIVVARLSDSAIVCAMKLKDGKKARRLSLWRYGSVPTGFEGAAERRLQEGDYAISIDAENGRGSATFRVLSDGKVVMVPE